MISWEIKVWFSAKLIALFNFLQRWKGKVFYVRLYELAILRFVDVTEAMNDFVGIFPLIVFELGQQVFIDVL